MTKSEIVDLSVKIARQLVGYHNHKEAKNLWLKDDGTDGECTLFAEALYQQGYYNGNKQGYDGCCTLGVDFCDLLACGLDKSLADSIFPNGDLGAGAKYSREYYANAGREFRDPKVGDRIFYLNGEGIAEHVGKVVEVNGSEITTVEFNVTGNLCAYRTLDYTKRNVMFGRPITDAEQTKIEVGAMVKLKQGAHCSNATGTDLGYAFSAWVYNMEMYIGTMTEKAARITTTKENADKGIFTGWVRIEDIEGAETVEEAPKTDNAPQIIPEGMVLVDKTELDRMEGLLATYSKENAELKERNGVLEIKLEKIADALKILREF